MEQELEKNMDGTVAVPEQTSAEAWLAYKKKQARRKCDSAMIGSNNMDCQITINKTNRVVSRTDGEAEDQCGDVLTDRVDGNHRQMHSAISVKGQKR